MVLRPAFHAASRPGLAACLIGAALVLSPWPGASSASAQTVADVRAEVDVLNGQIQQLRDELVRQGASGGLPVAPATALERLDQLEAELRRLTGRVDVLTNDIGRIVTDASNRVGDIEFRLTELEGGDTSLLAQGEAEPLGGGVTSLRPRPRGNAAAAGGSGAGTNAAAGAGGQQFAVAEQSDFEAALVASEEGRPAEAVALFDSFLATYPGGPLSSRAQLRRADALGAQGDWQGAARGYLDTFSGAPQDATAPEALYSLGRALGRLGKTGDACLTLTEVGIRYPGSDFAGQANNEKTALGCQ